jgi:hypothetical protein
MSMHRRPVGRARTLAAIGSVVIVAGCVLPWWTVGGGPDEITRVSGNAFDSVGIVVFIGALATLALITLPYARERPVPADRWPSYAVIATIAWLAFLYRFADRVISGFYSPSFFHDPLELVTRMPGLWVTAIGLTMLGRAVYDMRGEPRER